MARQTGSNSSMSNELKRMKMKKIFLLISMAAAVSFAGCQKNEIDGVDNANKEGSIFELVANICNDATKTTLDGRTVEWETGDIIYMVTEDEEWGAAYSSENNNLTTIAEFVYADGKFATESRISEGEHTFYAMYSRADQKTWHRGAGSSHSLLATQSQDCSAPTAHIKENDALVGTFTATTPMTAATVNMNHIYTMMQVDVRNNTGAEIEVTKFEMTAAEAALAGVFNIDFTTSTVSPKQNTSSAVTVKVTGGTVANNASLPVYFVMAPLTNYSGKVTFKVTDAKGNTYTKDVILSNVTFEAGKYNTTPYAISAADEVEEGVVKATLTFDDTSKRTEFDTYHQVWVENGITLTNEKGSSTSNVADYSNPARFYKSSNITISAPGNILALEFDCTGLADQYVTPFSSLEGASSANGVVTITLDGTTNTVTYEELSAQARAYAVTVTYMEGEGGGNQEPVQPEGPKTVTIADFIAAEESEQVYELTGTITSVKSSNYGNFDITDETGTVYIYGLVDADGSYVYTDLELKEGDIVTVQGQRTSYNGTPQMKNALYVSHVVGEAPEDTMMGETTVTAFLEAEVDAHVWYELTGVIANLNNTTYGNFDLVDETGSVYVYGLTSEKTDSNDKSFASLGLKEGDFVTLIGTRADYNGTAQVGGPAYYVSHIESCPAPVVTCENNIVTITSATGATVYYTTNGDEPTLNSDVYSNSFAITETITVKAIAVSEGMPQSAVTTTVCYWVDPNGEEITDVANLSFADKANRTSYSEEKQVWEQNGIVFTNDKASSKTTVGDYANPVRLYQGSTATINMANEDEQIVKIKFESDGTAKYKTALEDSLKEAGFIPTVEDNFYTIELPGPADSFTFSLTAQA